MMILMFKRQCKLQLFEWEIVISLASLERIFNILNFYWWWFCFYTIHCCFWQL